MSKFKTMKIIQKEKPFNAVLTEFSDAFVTGKFCDVKVVCKDMNLWAHRIVLGSVSPFLHGLMVDFEKRGDDVLTIFLPLIKGYHMKLVLDYIYSGAMYLCGAHMQFVIQVMEVLQLKCGVSVNKMVFSGEVEKGQNHWIEIEHSTVTIKTDQCNTEEKHHDDITTDQKSKNPKIEAPTKEQFIKDFIPISSKKKVVIRVVDDSLIDDISDHKNIEILSNSCIDDETKNIKQNDKLFVDLASDKQNFSSSLKSPINVDSDQENDVVMVELDEEFVVEKLSETTVDLDSIQTKENLNQTVVIGHPTAPSHRCILCGRTFNHYLNLQVHLTGHLGVKVKINRCAPCKRNFRNKRELDLHIKSHKYARHLGKFRTNTSKSVAPPRIITTTGSKEKKIVRKYLKKNEALVVQKPVIKNRQPILSKKVENLTCAICDKSFGVKSLLLRHLQKAHSDLAKNINIESLLQTVPSVKIKKVAVPNNVNECFKNTSSQFKTAIPQDQSLLLDTTSRTFSTPLSRGKEMLKSITNANKRKEKHKMDGESPKLPNYYNTLECPDCGKVFIAKSIFERHLQSAKHGIYGSVISDTDPFSPTNSVADFWAASDSKLLAETDSHNAKIECHLCGQSFVRIRDLVKHREKICQAYHSGKK